MSKLASDTTGPWPVLDDHRLAQGFTELLRHRARGQVGHTAGAERHDDTDRFGRKGLRLARTAGQAQPERQNPDNDPEKAAR
jgi:hypothetical protein